MAGLRFSTALVINRRILRGRLFIGPLHLAANLLGDPTASLVAALATQGAALATGGTGSTHLVWHRPPNGISGGQASVVTSYDGDQRFWVLRSRRD